MLTAVSDIPWPVLLLVALAALLLGVARVLREITLMRVATRGNDPDRAEVVRALAPSPRTLAIGRGTNNGEGGTPMSG